MFQVSALNFKLAFLHFFRKDKYYHSSSSLLLLFFSLSFSMSCIPINIYKRSKGRPTQQWIAKSRYISKTIHTKAQSNHLTTLNEGPKECIVSSQVYC